MNSFERTPEGHIVEEEFTGIFVRELEKRPRRNPLGQDVYLLPDGLIKRDEDPIIAAQRIWRERVYAPPGTPFAKRGTMYRKSLDDWRVRLSEFKELDR